MKCPFSRDEIATAVAMRAECKMKTEIGYALGRTWQEVDGALRVYDRQQREALELQEKLAKKAEIAKREAAMTERQRQAEIIAVCPEYEIIAPLWTKGLSVFAIIARVKRAGKAIEAADIHRIAVQHGLQRPETRRAA